MSIRIAKRVKTASVSTSSATDTVVVASKANTRICITGLFLRVTATNTLTFQKRGSDNTTLTALAGALPAAAAEQFNIRGTGETPLFVLGIDEDFVLTTGTTGAVVGWVTYTQETDVV